MKNLFIALGIVALLLFTAGPAFPYDEEQPETIPFTQATEDIDHTRSFVRVISTGIATGLAWNQNTNEWIEKQGHFQQAGSGTVVAPGFVLTCTHVIRPAKVCIAESWAVDRYADVVKLDFRTVMLLDAYDSPIMASVYYENQHTDITLLKFSTRKYPWLEPIKVRLHYATGHLAKMDMLMAVVHKRDNEGYIMGETMRVIWGRVVYPGPYNRDPRIQASLLPWDFTAILGIWPGDSGSSVFVFENGEPILIGIVRAFWWGMAFERYAYIVQLPMMEEMLNKPRDEEIHP